MQHRYRDSGRAKFNRANHRYHNSATGGTEGAILAPADVLSNYIEKYGEKFKSFRAWDFVWANGIYCVYDGEWRDVEVDILPGERPLPVYRKAIVAYKNHPIRIPFSVTPTNALYKGIVLIRSYDWYQYDGADAIVFNFKGEIGEGWNEDIFILQVRPQLFDKNMARTQVECEVYIKLLPDPDYPTSLEFKNKEVRIKPFEFYYQPVTILPEGSTVPELTWSCSNPSMATVTKEGKVYPVAEEGTVVISVTDGKNLSASYTAIIDVNGAGIDDVEADGANGAVEYYSLQGIRIEERNLAPGLYIRRQGNKAEKVFVK